MKEEEVFLRGLYELCSGENQEKVSAHVFGREFSAQSRAFTYFIKHMYNNIEHSKDSETYDEQKFKADIKIKVEDNEIAVLNKSLSLEKIIDLF